MLPRLERDLDDGWLIRNRQGNDNCLNVASVEQLFQPIVARVSLQVSCVLELWRCFRVFYRLRGPGPDGFEVEQW